MPPGVVQPVGVRADEAVEQLTAGDLRTATVGQTLSATTGTWSGTPPLSYAYQWQRRHPGCTTIASATGSSYTLKPADLWPACRWQSQRPTLLAVLLAELR